MVGLRPSPGLVPDGPLDDVWDTASVVGPMARTVGDLALMLSAISGQDRHSPLSHGDPASFEGALAGRLHGLRIAWCPDLGGLPIAPDVQAILGQARERLIACGCEVQDVVLDLDAADEAFETLRALAFVRSFGPELAALPDRAKATLVWNVERGLALNAPAIARAMAARSRVFVTVSELMDRFDVLAAPAAQVSPFPADQEYPTEIAGVTMPHYLGWMRACSRITVSAHPVAAVPAGFTTDGLPVGLQFVGRYREDRRLLEHAAAWEAASGLTERHPPLA